MSEWLLLTPNQQFFSYISWQEQVNFQWDDDEVRFVLDQHAELEDYKIGICCFSARYAALRRKSKDWLARNQNNVSEWSDMSICGLNGYLRLKVFFVYLEIF
jgi:hypothetical protein